MKLKYFTTDQMKRIYHYIDQNPRYPMNLCIELLALTGMRAKELMLLTFRDINTDTQRVEIRAAKGSQHRSAPISWSLCNRITEVAAEMGLNSYDLISDFISRDAIMTSRHNLLCQYFARIKAAAFIGQSLPGLHGFRHTVAKRVYESTRDVYAVKMALGHVAVSSTEHYMTCFSYEKLHNLLGQR